MNSALNKAVKIDFVKLWWSRVQIKLEIMDQAIGVGTKRKCVFESSVVNKKRLKLKVENEIGMCDVDATDATDVIKVLEANEVSAIESTTTDAVDVLEALSCVMNNEQPQSSFNMQL